MSRNSEIIKQKLQAAYDIPFFVKEEPKYNEPVFQIIPENNNEGLFEVNVEFKNNIRIIIEVVPEKFSVFSINDMARASVEKKHLFIQYAFLLIQKKAKIDFRINENQADPCSFKNWPDEWHSYGCRISRSPINGDGGMIDIASIAAEWATLVTGMFLSLLNVVSTDGEEESSGLRIEGGSNKIVVNKYERNPVNRELCLATNGYKCKICGFDFKNKYGELGNQFIHVHHIVPVSEMKTDYLIDPAKDLIPVCPNCHAMLHRKTPPLTPDELRDIIRLAGSAENL